MYPEVIAQDEQTVTVKFTRERWNQWLEEESYRQSKIVADAIIKGMEETRNRPGMTYEEAKVYLHNLLIEDDDDTIQTT